MRVCMTMKPGSTLLFLPLIQKGVGVKGRTGCTVRSFLTSELGLSPEYVEERVQTVFLNGKAVDDLDATMLREGATVSLSAAMPGLLGATLRRGSYYAAMRSQITHRGETAPDSCEEGMVFVKLFNLLISELAPALLRRGVWIRGEDLREILGGRGPGFPEGCAGISIDGQIVNPARLGEVKWEEELDLRVEETPLQPARNSP